MSAGIRVHYDQGATAFISGPKAEIRRRLAVCGDPAPVWVKRREAWATSTAAAAALLDQLEGRQHVPIEDHQQNELDLADTVPANSQIVQGVLW